MADQVQIRINGKALAVPIGTIVAVAIARAGIVRFRRSPSGQSRGALCGMGVCMECRVTINGRSQCRSCQILCREGMKVETDG
jgi:predicted molibdopterin-dependent oxidoreductase YjgC